jgi:hypothetical protein
MPLDSPTEKTPYNTHLAQWELTQLIESLCFYCKFVLVDNLVFQNRYCATRQNVMWQLKRHTLKQKSTYYIITLLTTLIFSCGIDKNKVTETQNELHSVSVDSLQPNTIQLRETFNEEDLPVNEYLTERLKPIRANYKRINSITNWTNIDTKELWETTEGGEAKYYYQKRQLEKITTRHFGETFQQLTEYYLMNGQLSFVFEKSYKYNRPMYYDTAAMKENNDTEAFDFEKSEIVEDRSYFENGKLLHQLNNQDCGSPFADDYLLEEQKRIKTGFEKLIELGRKK